MVKGPFRYQIRVTRILDQQFVRLYTVKFGTYCVRILNFITVRMSIVTLQTLVINGKF